MLIMKLSQKLEYHECSECGDFKKCQKEKKSNWVCLDCLPTMFNDIIEENNQVYDEMCQENFSYDNI